MEKVHPASATDNVADAKEAMAQMEFHLEASEKAVKEFKQKEI